MIEIYKKLPGTNCGECGESTCMAFALKVKNAQRKMPGCPYVKHEYETTFTQGPVVTMENNYKRVSRELEEEIKHVDLKEAAGAIGGSYDDRNGGGVIRLRMMNNEYEVRREGLFLNDKYCQDSWTKIIIYDYVRRKGNTHLTGDWVSLGHFKELEGVEVRSKIKADYVCAFDLLPRVPIYICFWDADEEFPASCKLHVDSSAEAYIDIEYLAYLLEWFVKVFVE
jgi:hypothetical protein